MVSRLEARPVRHGTARANRVGADARWEESRAIDWRGGEAERRRGGEKKRGEEGKRDKKGRGATEAGGMNVPRPGWKRVRSSAEEELPLRASGEGRKEDRAIGREEGGREGRKEERVRYFDLCYTVCGPYMIRYVVRKWSVYDP